MAVIRKYSSIDISGLKTFQFDKQKKNPARAGFHLCFFLCAKCLAFVFHFRLFLAMLLRNSSIFLIHNYSLIYFMVHCNYGKIRIGDKTIYIFCCPTEFRNSHKNSNNVSEPEWLILVFQNSTAKEFSLCQFFVPSWL